MSARFKSSITYNTACPFLSKRSNVFKESNMSNSIAGEHSIHLQRYEADKLVIRKVCKTKIIPNLTIILSYSPYYAKACNEFAMPIFARCSTATFVNVEAVTNGLQDN